ncbi:related to serine protease [Phialocephala subalpina]|uniref:tripeptidyl-peptidase II n=1 Tax=Phialocephala subalpina TaxID=576137 RepID=A0A1L7XQU7_9HELO|nr:related to serine protease [Phialocephala subalpina]
MKGIKSLLSLTALLVLANASAIPSYVEVHEKRESLHPRWTKRDRVESHKLFPMRIGLTQTNLDVGYEHLMDVSNPASANFGKHWTSKQVIDAFQPSKETENEVRKWLVENGIPSSRITHSENKGWFAFYATAEEAERLLHTEFHEYEDSESGGVIPGCEAYHLPKHVREHIDYVTPGIRLLAPVQRQSLKREVVVDENGLMKRNIHGLLQNPSDASYTKPNDLSTCDVAITPDCVAALYKIPPGKTSHPNNSLGIFESELQFYTQQDLDLFFTNFTTPQHIPNGTHPIAANIDGGLGVIEDPYYAGGEVSLDLELAYPIVYPQTITLYNVDDFIVQANQNDTYTFGFNTFLDALDGSYCSFSAYNETGNDPNLDQEYPDPLLGGWQGQLMCGVYKPTNVISLSYGGQESDLPISYQKRQCLEYMKLGLQGVSFLFASGDSGVSNYPASVGGIDGPTGCLGPNLDIFNPTWPGTCPYVTSVGATKVYPGKTVNDSESAVFDPAGFPYSVNYSSGGGFSNIYPIPDYQASAVKVYFDNHDPGYPYYSALSPDTGDIKLLPDVGALAGSTGGIYNRIGRGIPDVAANGDNIAVYNGGNFTLSGGTSASTPIFSAVITRLNEERINAGKGPIGFLNPSLYANPSMLNDITNGSNPGCNTIGFSAVKGWDPVTGLGTPNFPKMLEYYMSLP